MTPNAHAIDRTLARLSRSTFRSRFRLSDDDAAYARLKGRDTIAHHAHDLLRARIGPAHPRNDGRQTPMRGHPVFIGQHATATCCRGCIAKWHGITQGHELTEAELGHLVDVVMAWIEGQLLAHPAPGPDAGTHHGARRPNSSDQLF